jgi:hypothetical protein
MFTLPSSKDCRLIGRGCNHENEGRDGRNEKRRAKRGYVYNQPMKLANKHIKQD